MLKACVEQPSNVNLTETKNSALTKDSLNFIKVHNLPVLLYSKQMIT